jgi:sarcosine oxidase subunit beta
MLASEAIARWPSLKDELGHDLAYRRGGNLHVADSDERAEQLQHYVAEQQLHGFTDVRLVDRATALELAPGLGDRVIAGSYSPADGHADPRLTTNAFANAAQRQGARYRRERVLRVESNDDGAAFIETAAGRIEAEEIVVCAGAWSNHLLGWAGLPLRRTPSQMLLTTAAEPDLLRPVIGAAGPLSLKQLPGGEFFIGGGWPGTENPDGESCGTRPDSIEGSWANAVAIYPVVGRQKIQQAWCGLEASTIDAIPVIGRLRDQLNLSVATGFSGHGFAISPAVGRAMAELLSGHPTPQLAGLDPRRFADLAPERIRRFNELPEYPLGVAFG